MFTRIVSPQRKVLGDNPDALYYWARIDGTRAYRIRGTLGDAVYTSITAHGADPAGGSMERVIAAVSDRELSLGAGGQYEIVLSPERHDGSWLRLDPDATSVITRHYYERPVSIACEADVPVPVRIEPLHAASLPPPLDDATLHRGGRGPLKIAVASHDLKFFDRVLEYLAAVSYTHLTLPTIYSV